MKKKLLCLLLVLAMVLPIVPVLAISVSAEEPGASSVQSENSVDYSTELPSEYTEVEYLISDGNQQILLNIESLEDVSIETSFLNNGNNYQHIMATNGLLIQMDGANQNITLYASSNLIYSTKYSGDWVTVKISQTAAYINGVKVKTFTCNGTNTTKLSLFAPVNNGADYRFSGYMSAARIYDGDELFADLIPCVRNSDGKPGMYDLVSNTFFVNGNSGSDFTVPTKIVLPDAYRKVEALHGTGIQSIEVPLNDESSLSFEVNYKADSYQGYKHVIRVSGSPKGALIQDYDGAKCGTVYNASTYSDYSYSSLKVTAKAGPEGFFLNGVSKMSLPDGNTAFSKLMIFGVNDGYGFVGNIYEAKVYNGDEVVNHLIPCVRLFDDKPGMYDIITNQFYSNVNETEDFTVVGYELEETSYVLSLPDAYSLIDYLYANGEQHIFLDDIGTNHETTFEVCYKADASNGYTHVLATIGTTKNWTLIQDYNASTVQFQYIHQNRTSDLKGINYTAGSAISVRIGPNGIFINDVFKSLTKQMTETSTGVWLFGQNSDVRFKGCIYGVNIWDGIELTHQLVPAVRNSDKEPGLYDVCTGKFYFNELTDSDFICGGYSEFTWSDRGVVSKETNGILYLPSYADFSDMSGLNLPNGTTVSNGVETITISEDGELDLYDLYDTMDVATLYTLTITKPSDSAKTVNIVKSANVSTMFVTSNKSIDCINASKSNVGKGQVAFLDESGNFVYNDGLDSFKGRGSASWNNITDQKPYNIKLSQKAELIGGAGKAKKWCLLSGDMYANLVWITVNPMMVQLTGYQLYKDLGGAYSFDYSVIDLYYNNEYRGCYLMVEAVQIDKSRIDITKTDYDIDGSEFINGSITVNSNGTNKSIVARWSTDAVIAEGTSTGGFVLEWENSTSSIEDCYFVTTYGNRYLFKDPQEPTKEQIKLIAQYIQNFEDALFADSGYNINGQYYADLIDLDSLAIELATSLYLSDNDGFWRSEYFTVDIDSLGCLTKIVAGPTWDFDSNFMANKAFRHCIPGFNEGNSDNTYGINTMSQFLKHGDFVYKANEVILGAAKTLAESYVADNGFLDDFIETYGLAKAVSKLRWPDSIFDFNASATTTKSAAAFKSDFSYWINEISTQVWNLDYLRGNTIIYDSSNNKLVANSNISNANASYQWYTVNKSTGALTAIAGAVTNELEDPDFDTVYEVASVVTGTNVVKTRCVSGVKGYEIYNKKGLYNSLATNTPVASMQFSSPVLLGIASVIHNEVTTYYTSLEEALDVAVFGDAVFLSQNTTANYVVIETGITLDLNGCNVTSKLFYATGAVIDNGTTKGIVKADNYVLTPGVGSYTPVGRGELGYSFYMLKVNGMISNETDTSVKFSFQNKYKDDYEADRNALLGLLAENISATKVKFVATVSWTEENTTVSQNFVYTDAFVTIYSDATKNMAFGLTVNGLDQLNKEIKIVGSIVTYDANGNVLATLKTAEQTVAAKTAPQS